MISPIVYVDLKRMIKNLRCSGMSEAEVLFEVAEILRYNLYDDGEDFE